MIKLKLVILCLMVSFSVSAQKMDTLRVADSITTISVKDVDDLLKYYYEGGKVSAKDFDLLKSFSGVLLQYTDKRRLIIKKHL